MATRPFGMIGFQSTAGGEPRGVYSGDINGLDNLVGMLPEDHAGISEAWRIWKVGLQGGMPSEAEILAQRDSLTRIYGALMVSSRQPTLASQTCWRSPAGLRCPLVMISRVAHRSKSLACSRREQVSELHLSSEPGSQPAK